MTAEELGLPETKTLRDQLVLFLVNNFLWPNEANNILDIVIADKKNEDVKFNSPVEYYPNQLIAVLQILVADVAIIWIDKNKPKHFARNFLLIKCGKELK